MVVAEVRAGGYPDARRLARGHGPLLGGRALKTAGGGTGQS
jgi:hypothetical protein